MSRFSDHVIITLVSGKGGAGSASFRREKYVPRGGPDGGDGGRGGSIRFVCRDNLKTLGHLRPNGTYRADDGEAGRFRNRHGKDGADVEIAVPPGTQVRDAEDNSVICDLLKVGETHVVLEGGRGGKGNTHFVSSTNRAPRFSQPGEPGSSLKVVVELRVIADIGLVGLPNAGKSSLLAATTNALPEVAAYPFTTTSPNLGVVEREFDHLVLADIPGLIEGAAGGAGLGTRFLQHLSRTLGLCFVVDVSGEAPEDAVAVVQNELQSYGGAPISRPRIIVGNKNDLHQAEAGLEALRNAFPDDAVISVSALSGDGLDAFVDALFDLREKVRGAGVHP